VKTLSSRQQHLKEYWRGLDIGWSKVEECTRGVEAAGVFRPVTTDPAGGDEVGGAGKDHVEMTEVCCQAACWRVEVKHLLTVVIPEDWGATGVKDLVCTDFDGERMEPLKTFYALLLAGEGQDWLNEWHLMKEVTPTFCEEKAAVSGILDAHLIELSAVFEARRGTTRRRKRNGAMSHQLQRVKVACARLSRGCDLVQQIWTKFQPCVTII